MKVLKYILSILLMLSALGGLFSGEFLTGLFFLILGIIILPPISEKLNNKISFWKNKGVRYATYLVLFILAGSSIKKSTLKSPQSKKEVLISYIKNDTIDKSIINIKKFIEVSELFGNKNIALKHPQKRYISEKYDSISNTFILVFNPRFEFVNTENSKYLKNDMANGRVKSYIIRIIVNENDSILSKSTVITYTKTGEKIITNNEVPKFESFIDTVIVNHRKEEIAHKLQVIKERNHFNKVMGSSDFWNKYDPIVKQRIYKLIENKDCSELQNEFNNAADMMEKKQSSRIGSEKELELVSFLDNKLKESECY